MKIGENKEKKTTLQRENLQNVEKISQFYMKKIPSVRIQMTGENTEFHSEFNEILLKIQIKLKMKEKKTTIERENLQNFQKTTIGEEKIRLIPIEITGEFNNEFNEI